MHPLRQELAESTTQRVAQGCETLGISLPEAEELIHKIAHALPTQYIAHFENNYFKDQMVDKIACEFILFQSGENLYDSIYPKHFTDFIYTLVYELNSIFKRKT